MKKLAILASLLLASFTTYQEKTVQIAIFTDQKDCIINEDIQLEVKIENTMDKAAEINEFLFDEQSVSFEITTPTKKYVYSIMRDDPHLREKLPLSKISLGSKKSISNLFKIPAIKTGKIELVAYFNGYENKKIMSNKIEVEVKATGDGQNKLAAVMEVTIDKDKKSYMFEFLTEQAPVGVSNFVNLAKRGFYNGLKFYRVEKQNWIQSGCPYNLGIAGPGFCFKNEASEQTGLSHDIGTLSQSGFKKQGYCGSQFFICLSKLDFLNTKYPIIARAKDQETKDKIKKDLYALEDNPPDSTKPAKEVTIESIKIVTSK